jgi:hypothetical protein
MVPQGLKEGYGQDTIDGNVMLPGIAFGSGYFSILHHAATIETGMFPLAGNLF